MPPGKSGLVVPCLGTLIVLVSLVHFTGGLAVMSVDLGSQFMKIAIVKPGVPMEMALNKESRRKTPVAVSFRNGERLFSDGALGVSVSHPSMSYIYLHDLLAKKIDNPQVQLYKQRFPWYDMEEDKETGTVVFKHQSGSKYSPEELMGMILNHSRIIAEEFAEHPMKDIVITIPPYFNQAERRAVLRAAELVGLNVLQLMNGNTAVALNFGLFQQKTFNESLERHVMFYDMGASSTVATIVGYSMGKSKERGITEKAPQLVIKGVGFDRTLGGHAIDIRLRDHLIQLFKKNYKSNGEVTESPRAMAKFYKEALRVKQVLSANTEHFAQIEGVFEETNFRAKVTRAELEEMSSDLFERVANPVYQALKASAMTMNDIESVILVGGGTRVPKVQEVLLKAVEKSELAKNINADEAAAMGAVYQAAHLGKGFKVKPFLIRDFNIYPIQVAFDRHSKAEDGSETVKHVKRVLYHHGNVVPQKKVMTFNKHTEDFQFHVSYSGLENILSDKDIGVFGSLNLSTVSIKGVDTALSKHTPKGTSKGIKSYFRLDDNGMFKLDKVESVFEKMPEDVEEQSAFAKLGSKISSFFGGSEEKKDGKTEESKGEKAEEAKEEKPEDEKEAKKEKKEDAKEETKEEEKKPEEKKESEEKKTEEKDKEQPKEETKKSEDQEKSKDEGKKETEDKKDEGKEPKKEADKEVKGNKTEEVPKKKEPVKPVLVREALETAIEVHDFTDPSQEAVTASKTKLEKLNDLDEAKKAKERSKNALESHIFSVREKLEGDLGEKLSTEAERDTVNQALSQASDWLDDEGWDVAADVYDKKLNDLKKISQDFRRRMNEHSLRPKAVASLLQSLNLSTTFSRQINNMTEKNEIYTVRDLEDFEKTNNETMDWLALMMKKQNETKPHENPAVLAKDIEAKQFKIDRELVYLLNKAKYYVPKPKNDTVNASNKTSSNTTKSSSDKQNKTSDKTSGFKTKKAFKKPEKKNVKNKEEPKPTSTPDNKTKKETPKSEENPEPKPTSTPDNKAKKETPKSEENPEPKPTSTPDNKTKKETPKSEEKPEEPLPSPSKAESSEKANTDTDSEKDTKAGDEL